MRGLNGEFLGTLGASGARSASSRAAASLPAISSAWSRGASRNAPVPIGPSPSAVTLTMAAVPAMAFAFNWQTAAVFVVLERTGKAIRSPATSTMQSRAAT